MSPDELVDVIELAYAESGRDPDLNTAAVWAAAVGEFPVEQVKAAVARFLAGHVWPPKAAEIRRILVGVDEHGAGRSFTTAVALVRGGRVTPPFDGEPVSADDLGDRVAWATWQALGAGRWWRETPEVEQRAAWVREYQRQSEMAVAGPALEAGPQRAAVTGLPVIGTRI